MYTTYRTEVDKLEEQLLFRRCRIGQDAAREIARRVEDGHGFWDFDVRKQPEGGQETESASSISVVDVEVHDGVSHQSLAGPRPGEDTPKIAA